MSLEQKDIELLERVIYKNGDDVAVSVARSFERLEERIDAAESRIYSRLADVEDKIDTGHHELAHEFMELKNGIGEIVRARSISQEVASDFALAE